MRRKVITGVGSMEIHCDDCLHVAHSGAGGGQHLQTEENSCQKTSSIVKVRLADVCQNASSVYLLCDLGKLFHLSELL